MIFRALPFVLLLGCTTSGGGVGSPASCKLDDVLEAELSDVHPRDCGNLGTQATVAELTAAKNCVLAAIEAHEQFVVVWNIQGIDSRVARAFYGVFPEGDGAALDLKSVSYDGDPGGGGGENHPSTTTSSCASLTEQPSCGDDTLPYSLCLQCVSSTVSDTCKTPL